MLAGAAESLRQIKIELFEVSELIRKKRRNERSVRPQSLAIGGNSHCRHTESRKPLRLLGLESCGGGRGSNSQCCTQPRPQGPQMMLLEIERSLLISVREVKTPVFAIAELPKCDACLSVKQRIAVVETVPREEPRECRVYAED